MGLSPYSHFINFDFVSLALIKDISIVVCRQNAITLEEKEKREKELLSQIIDEADEYKVEFYRRRAVTCETSKNMNREKEKVRLGFLSIYSFVSLFIFVFNFHN